MVWDVFENEKKVLEVETRKRIYFLVKKFAGIHFREVQRKCGLAVGLVQYHLNFLVKKDLIKEIKSGKNVLYFPVECVVDDVKVLGLLRQDSLRKIFLFLLMHDVVFHEQIVKFVGLSPSTISWHLKKLQESGFVKAESKERKTCYSLSYDKDVLVKLLITYKESFFDELVDHVIEMWSFE